jgi:DNA mismatch repair protein MutL
VVKELLENALDAGARTIRVEIEHGGIERICLSDDGSGMSAEEARLAVRRHATSKIARIEDLGRIATMGFRGEALPAIASVTRFTLTTRAEKDLAATRIAIAGGAEPEVRETGGAVGTTVEVRDLFYNVPARRKFLKSKATESAHVAEVCVRAALSEPLLRLTLLRDGKRARELLPQQGREARAREAFGGEKLVTLAGERDGVRVEAFLGAPERARAGTSGLYVHVNRRPVRDRALARAVAFAYGSVLPPGRFPVGVVYVDVDPAIVDVNVHPQKHEVRFADTRNVLDAITRALATRLGTSAWGGPAARGSAFWEEKLGYRRSSAPPLLVSAPDDVIGPDTGSAHEVAAAFRESREAYASPENGGAEVGQTGIAAASSGFFGALRVLGQVRKMLIVCEADDALHVLDQHAADERLRYHRLRTSYRARTVATQRLLFPERVELGASEALVVEERRDDLLALGLDCVPVGPTTCAVHSVPSLVRRAPAERLLRDVLDELMRSGERAFGDAVDTALATMACHGSIRAGDPLSLEECTALVRSLDEIDDFAGHCPHGRPIVYSAPFADIERRLGR